MQVCSTIGLDFHNSGIDLGYFGVDGNDNLATFSDLVAKAASTASKVHVITENRCLRLRLTIRDPFSSPLQQQHSTIVN